MEKIAVGIVTFNSEIDCLKKNIESIVNQVEVIYIIDNGSDNWQEIESVVQNEEKCVIQRFNNNEGIAKALNTLCLKAQENGYEWILTLDQDTICPPNIIEEFREYLCLEKVAMLTAAVFDRNRGTFNSKLNTKYSEVNNCITSGSLLNLNVWNELKGFDEYLFIDGVDFDICHRIVMAGYKIYRINSVIINHEIGKSEYKNIFGWKVIVMHHSAFRKYYIARNNIYLARKGVWKISRGLLRNMKIFLLTILFEKQKCIKIKKIIKGTIDGFKSNNL